jgi:predicted transcriptional regulator of viral defense system
MAPRNLSILLNTDSPFLNISSIQALFNITRESAKTTASRLVERGILIRLRRDLYVLVNRKYSLFSLANAIYQPSVISLETALNYWGLIVQVPQIIFSVGLETHQCVVDNATFVYRRIDPFLFRFGQVRAEDFYIAGPEKALLDTLYMKSKGLVELLPEDVDMAKLDGERLNEYSQLFPETVRKTIRLFQQRSYEAK